MILRDVLAQGVDILTSSDIEAPAVDAGVILCHVLKRDKAYLYAHGEYMLAEREQDEFFRLIEGRARGIPVQHLTGWQEFMSLPFLVSPHVLIPRHDTETLVESIIDYVKKAPNRPANILDIGTGSGCIAVSLAYYLKESRVTALDISAEALKIAQENAERNAVADRIEFIESNVFEKINGIKKYRKAFDVIVSNPPYIPTREIEDLQIEVKSHDPRLALDGGVDGLNFYRKIVHESPDFLKTYGLLAFEVGYDQAHSVATLMSCNYSWIRKIKDLAGVDRVVAGKLEAKE